MLSDAHPHANSSLDLPEPPAAGNDAITAGDLLKHIEVLAAPEFEGRSPGSRGEELSVAYITAQFQALGLEPGNPDGTYVQEVPLAGITSTPVAAFTVGGHVTTLNFPDDFVAGSNRLVTEVEATESPVVFVGYGVAAPEYGWDDYKGVDVRGKTLLMLISDPAIPDPQEPGKLDASMFKGKEMTYYGRWTYKYEIAAKMGAAAAVIIHETGPAGYPYSVVRMSWGKEHFTIDAPDRNMATVPVRSWITREVAAKLCADSGHPLEQLKQAALSRDFRPIEMGIKANFHVRQAVRPFQSHNVLAALPGANAARADEWLIYTAHWDHLGKQSALQGNGIFHGAVDNASGVAALFNLARAFTVATPRAERSVLFMAPTAEESGLLGAQYYAEHPLYPLDKTLANINIDGISVHGKTADLEDLSNDNSTLDDLLGAAAARQGRTLKPNSRLENGGFYRADHFEFAKVGVPALYMKHGVELIGQPPGLGEKLESEFIAERYHKPADQVSPDWDLSGAVQDMQLLFQVGWAVANADTFPIWKPGSEFKARRDAMLAGK
jgi:Zn-dependent M28 family amino/carboxypeptidase